MRCFQKKQRKKLFFKKHIAIFEHLFSHQPPNKNDNKQEPAMVVLPNPSPISPWKINMDHNHGGLEDHFPF